MSQQRPQPMRQQSDSQRQSVTEKDEVARQREQIRKTGYMGTAEKAQTFQYESAQQYVKQAAPVTEEHIYETDVHELRPEVTRTHDVTEIRHTLLPITDQVREPTRYTEKRLDTMNEREYYMGFSEQERIKHDRLQHQMASNQRQDLEVKHEYVCRKPIVNDVIRPRIVHEIQPVVRREVRRNHVEREYLPIHEHLIEGPRVRDEIDVLPAISREEWEQQCSSGGFGRNLGWKPISDDRFLYESGHNSEGQVGDHRRHESQFAGGHPSFNHHPDHVSMEQRIAGRRGDSPFSQGVSHSDSFRARHQHPRLSHPLGPGHHSPSHHQQGFGAQYQGPQYQGPQYQGPQYQGSQYQGSQYQGSQHQGPPPQYHRQNSTPQFHHGPPHQFRQGSGPQYQPSQGVSGNRYNAQPNY